MSRASAKIERDKFWERNRKSDGYLLKKTINSGLYKVARAILLFGLCFLIIQPLLNKISISLMEERDLYDSTINVIPRHFTLDNFKIASNLMEYWKALGNTFWISLLVSILQIISSRKATGTGKPRIIRKTMRPCLQRI